jgi:3-oxoacyl-[acyl-carrier-protein] synthase-3
MQNQRSTQRSTQRDPKLPTTRGSAIAGWGTALPATTVTNDDLSRVLDTTDAWIKERSGIGERRVTWGPFANPEDLAERVSPPGGLGTTGKLAVEAGQRALERSNLGPHDIDLMILCTTTPDQSVPASSSPVAAALGLQCGAFDLNAACAGFVYGLVTASGFISAGFDRILLIGAESLSRITNWEDRSTAVLFGDGAGAAVIEAVPGEGSLLGWDLGVDGSLQSILYADLGAHMIMEGKEVFRRAVRAVVDSANLAIERAKVSPDDIALFVPHQANARIIEAVCSRLGIPKERSAIVLDRTGNTSSASIPLALAAAADEGRVADGDLVLLSGFGAGMTWASAVWRWGK